MPAHDEQIVALYERHAHRYDLDRNRSLAVERQWLERFTALLPAGAPILDIGCGHGEPIARHLIEAGFAVTGVDSAPTLIGLCRRRFPESDWQRGDMRGLALGRTFRGLIAWDSFFHLNHADQRAMFPVFAAHAAADAVLMFTSGTAHGVATGEYHGDPLFHASLDPAEYERLLGENGFAVRQFVADDAAAGGHTVWLAQRRTGAPLRADSPIRP